MKNNKGRNSLIIAVIGLITIQTLLYFKYIENQWWYILLAGFEAATVGGFADWFAVKALFREIPIPFVKKHTNIIVKNRDKISNGIIDLVTNQWLSPEVIERKIAKISIADKILGYLKDTNSKSVYTFIKPILIHLTSSLDVSSFIKTQLQNINVGEYLGSALKNSVGSQGYNKFLQMVLETVKNTINSEKTKQILGDTVQKQMDTYKEKSPLSGLLMTIGKATNGIDKDTITNKLISSLDEFIEKAKNNDTDPLRLKIDNYILEFSDKLIRNDAEVYAILTIVKDKLKSVDFKGVTNAITAGISNDSRVEKFFDEQLQIFVNKLIENEVLKSDFNEGIKKIVGRIIADNHDEIGKMVADSLNSLDDKAMVAQIEDKVGDDLQYIRLNGALVGGLVGVVIALIKLGLSV